MNRTAGLAARLAFCAAVVGLTSAGGLAVSVACAFALDDPRASRVAFVFLTLMLACLVFAVIADALARHGHRTRRGFAVMLARSADDPPV